jgi:branched-chain amino acid transport system permease protein
VTDNVENSLVKNKYIKGKYIVFLLLIIAASVLPFIIKNTYYTMVFNQTLVNIIVVLGLNFITGLTGQMNLGTAGIFAIGAYITGLLTVRWHISPWIALFLAIPAGYLIGRGLGYPSLRLKGVYLALTTIGFTEIVRLLATNLSGLTGGTQGIQRIPGLHFFGIYISTNEGFYYFLLICVIIMVLLSMKIIHSKWGRAFKAIRDNIDAVEACGINVADIKIKAFTLASIYGCIGGALYANLFGYINPSTFNLDMSFNFLVMLMVGGIGSIGGNVIGAILVTVLPELLRFLQNYYWLIFSVIVLIFVIWQPNGLAALFENIYKAVKSKLFIKKGGNDIVDDPKVK